MADDIKSNRLWIPQRLAIAAVATDKGQVTYQCPQRTLVLGVVASLVPGVAANQPSWAEVCAYIGDSDADGSYTQIVQRKNVFCRGFVSAGQIVGRELPCKQWIESGDKFTIMVSPALDNAGALAAAAFVVYPWGDITGDLTQGYKAK